MPAGGFPTSSRWSASPLRAGVAGVAGVVGVCGDAADMAVVLGDASGGNGAWRAGRQAGRWWW